MDRHEISRRTTLGRVELVALLGARPTSWLRRFLRLALAAGAPGGGQGDGGWYRLGMLETNDPFAVTFHWRPNGGSGTMSSFRGAFEVRGPERAATVRLRGTATGGDAEADRAVLEALVDLLVSAALEARRDPGNR